MNLKEFIEDSGISITKLAKKAGITSATIYNIFNGRDVKLSIAVKIQRATKNKVTCEDIYEDFIEKKKT